MTSLTIPKPYDLNLACNEATNQYGLTTDKIHDLERKLDQGDFNSFKAVILDLPAQEVTFIPDGLAIRVSYAYRKGIYTLFPVDLAKWVTFHVQRNIHQLTEGECKKLHDAFWRSNLFTTDEPDPLAFMLASSVYRKAHLEGKTAEYLEKYNPKIVASFINKCEVPSPTSFTAAALFLKTVNYWSLDIERPSYLLFCRCIDTVVWGQNENQVWQEMVDAVITLDDKILLDYVKDTFCQKFLLNVCHEINSEFPHPQESSIYALPVSAVPYLAKSGPFFGYLAAKANAISLSSTVSSSLPENLKANFQQVLTKLGTLVVTIHTHPSLIVQIFDTCPNIRRIYVKCNISRDIWSQKWMSLDKFAPFLEKGIILEFAESDLDLQVSNESWLKNVRFYRLESLCITFKNLNAKIQFDGWISRPVLKRDTVKYTFYRQE